MRKEIFKLSVVERGKIEPMVIIHSIVANNNPACRACLLRIPGSYNSKYRLHKSRDFAEE
jgi:hypothetical protein